MIRFAVGRTVLYRNVGRDRVASVRPCRVIADDERGLLLWLAPRSPVAVEVAEDGRGIREMPFAEWIGLRHGLRTATWQGPGVLKFVPPGVDHSVWFFRDDAGRFTSWYVNLEERGVRWDDGEAAGVDVVDQDLDLVVAPDRSWRWKDEHEFAERLAYPEHYWVRDEAAVRAEGAAVIKKIEAADFPFDGTWTDFTPDPAWPTPDLPPGWSRPSAR
jgi:Protein of unknown function (DUF402)